VKTVPTAGRHLLTTLQAAQERLKRIENWIAAQPATAGPAPATTVTGPDAFGAAAHVGMDTAHFARGDHDHGLPGAPPSNGGGYAFQPPTPGTSNIISVCSGPDGNLWTLDAGANAVVKYSTAGAVLASYAAPRSGAVAGSGGGIVAAPDGNLWWCEQNEYRIVRTTTAGVMTEYACPGGSGNSYPYGICVGPDSNVWFTEVYSGYPKLAQMNLSTLTITEYGLAGGANYQPGSVCSGPDGRLWVTSNSGPTPILAVTTAGVQTLYNGWSGIVGNRGNTTWQSIVSDGTYLWVAVFDGGTTGYFAKVTTAGSISVIASSVALGGLALGSDGNLWATQRDPTGPFNLMRFSDPGMAATPFPVQLVPSDGICNGPDGNLWIASGAYGLMRFAI